MTEAHAYVKRLDKMKKDAVIALKEVLGAYSKGFQATSDEVRHIVSSLKLVHFRHNTLLDIASPLTVMAIKSIQSEFKMTEEGFGEFMASIDLNTAYMKETKISFGSVSQKV
jgi:hypothetical protein